MNWVDDFLRRTAGVGAVEDGAGVFGFAGCLEKGVSGLCYVGYRIQACKGFVALDTGFDGGEPKEYIDFYCAATSFAWLLLSEFKHDWGRM